MSRIPVQFNPTPDHHSTELPHLNRTLRPPFDSRGALNPRADESSALRGLGSRKGSGVRQPAWLVDFSFCGDGVHLACQISL